VAANRLVLLLTEIVARAVDTCTSIIELLSYVESESWDTGDAVLDLVTLTSEAGRITAHRHTIDDYFLRWTGIGTCIL
jgi:hypothetical protein